MKDVMSSSERKGKTEGSSIETDRCVVTGSQAEVRIDELLRTIPSKTLSIHDCLTLKDGNLFFLCKTFGDVPFSEDSAEGLYYHDCRYLSGYELRLADRPMETLVSTAGKGYEALVELTNPDLYKPDGDLFARSEEIGVKWLRRVDEASLTLLDEISLRNLGARTLTFPVTISMMADFRDIFSVRSLVDQRRGRVHPSRWVDGCLHYRYDGCDGLVRQMWVCPQKEPTLAEKDRMVFMVTLGPREEKSLTLLIAISEEEEGQASQRPPAMAPTRAEAGARERTKQKSAALSLADVTEVHSSSLLIDSIIERSFRDLQMLRSSIDGEDYYAAGVPWFTTLFGRDSIIAALQTLPYDASIAEQTLRILAKYQGTAVNAWREEEPGKIMHEIRVGELARTGEIPHSPYYGTVDATPLFLILAARYHAWTGDDALFEELRPNIEAAEEWMRLSDRAVGYITYESMHARSLTNQGWKDSENGIQNIDGSLAEPPIALVEVQAYAYRARLELSELYFRMGDDRRCLLLRQEARELRDRFNRDYWLPRRKCFALALGKNGRPAAVISSNAGHALWAGIAERPRAQEVCRRLMKPDMFSGWGIRTMSSNEIGYSPIGYHVGSVWPHDNSMILHGFRRYNFDREATALFTGMIQAAMNFDLYRLPELFAGFSRSEYEVPVHYPLANKPQAWAAGAIPYMLASMLGLAPDAPSSRLRVLRPALPEFVSRVDLKGLKVGKNRVDLRFERTPSGVAVQVQKKDRGLNIVVEL